MDSSDVSVLRLLDSEKSISPKISASFFPLSLLGVAAVFIYRAVSAGG